MTSASCIDISNLFVTYYRFFKKITLAETGWRVRDISVMLFLTTAQESAISSIKILI